MRFNYLGFWDILLIMEQDTYQFDEVRGSLIFTVSKVELETSGEEPIEGLFDLEEQNGLDVEGYVYSSSFLLS